MPRTKPADMPDFGAIYLGSNPTQTQRVLGLIRAGHPRAYIVEVGRYQGTWTAADVDRILRANRVRALGAPPHRTPTPTARTIRLAPTMAKVAYAVSQGLTNDEIATYLKLSPNTVRSYVGTVLRATGSRDRVALVVAVLTRRLNVIEEEDQA